jgi:hypothetical protein
VSQQEYRFVGNAVHAAKMRPQYEGDGRRSARGCSPSCLSRAGISAGCCTLDRWERLILALSTAKEKRGQEVRQAGGPPLAAHLADEEQAFLRTCDPSIVASSASTFSSGCEPGALRHDDHHILCVYHTTQYFFVLLLILYCAGVKCSIIPAACTYVQLILDIY